MKRNNDFSEEIRFWIILGVGCMAAPHVYFASHSWSLTFAYLLSLFALYYVSGVIIEHIVRWMYRRHVRESVRKARMIALVDPTDRFNP